MFRRPIVTLHTRTIPHYDQPRRGWPLWVLRRNVNDGWIGLVIRLLEFASPPIRPAISSNSIWYLYTDFLGLPKYSEFELGGFSVKVDATPVQSMIRVFEADQLILWLHLLWKRGQYVFRVLAYEAEVATATAVCLTLAVAAD